MAQICFNSYLHQSTTVPATTAYDGSHFLSVQCPRGWVSSFYGECFKFHSNPLDWNSAKNACDAQGSNLAVLNSKTKLREFPESAAPRFRWFWFGLYRDPMNKRRWPWIGGSTALFTSWAKGEPNNARLDEDCVEMILPSKKWNDNPCSFLRPYICEINGKYNNLCELKQWFETSFMIRKKETRRLRSPIFIWPWVAIISWWLQ